MIKQEESFYAKSPIPSKEQLDKDNSNNNMTKQEERIKEFVLNVTYGGRGSYLDDTLPVEEFEELLKSFIQSEIDLALANRNKEMIDNMDDILIETGGLPELALPKLINLIIKDK